MLPVVASRRASSHHVASAARAGLGFTLGSAFSVQEEVSVGKMPPRVDILLIRREGGQHGNPGGRNLGCVAAAQPIHSFEFKGPTDSLEREISDSCWGSFLWHSQADEPIPHEEISLIVLAPAVNNAFRDELRLLGSQPARRSLEFTV